MAEALRDFLTDRCSFFDDPLAHRFWRIRYFVGCLSRCLGRGAVLSVSITYDGETDTYQLAFQLCPLAHPLDVVVPRLFSLLDTELVFAITAYRDFFTIFF